MVSFLEWYSTLPIKNKKLSAGKNITSPSAPTRLMTIALRRSNSTTPLRPSSRSMIAAIRITDVSRFKCFLASSI